MFMKICNYPSCGEIAIQGTSRCESHPYKRSGKRDNTHRYHNGQDIYNTSRWQKLRNKKRRMNPLCEHCEDKGFIVPADIVDHTIELADGGDPYPALSGLQSLCHSCHNSKTKQSKSNRA